MHSGPVLPNHLDSIPENMVKIVPIQIDNPKYHKKTIPKALKEQVWLLHMGRVFEGKCRTRWCNNKMTVFDFHTSHDVAEVNGGTTDIHNLIPLCSKCNLSMGTMTFKEWSQIVRITRKWWRCLF